VDGDAHNSDAGRKKRDGRVEEELVSAAHAPNVPLLAAGRVLPQE
jgi:hypothetical protein